MKERTTQAATDFDIKAKLFRGFADLSRLIILETLRDGPRTVGDLAKETDLTQPNVSNHLACLLECGLVDRMQQGRFAVYSLATREAEEILRISDDLIQLTHGLASCSRYPSLTVTPGRAAASGRE